MKKILLILAFAPAFLIACKTNNTEEKIDFTKSYENAALALTTAQDKYEKAIATNDATQINAAKAELQSATASYISSKNKLVSHGGNVSQSYEQTLEKSEKVLSVTPPSKDTSSKLATTIQTGNATIDKAAATVDNVHKNITDKIDKANKVQEDLAAKKAKAKANIEKTKNDFNATKKETSDEVKKFKSNLDNLLKN